MKSIIIIFLIIINCHPILGEQQHVEIKTIIQSSIRISPESVSSPGVYLTDDVTLDYFKPTKTIGIYKDKVENLNALLKGDLDPDNEPFVAEWVELYGIKIDNENWIIIFKEKGGNRYEACHGVASDGIVFQKSARQMWSRKGLEEILKLPSKEKDSG